MDKSVEIRAIKSDEIAALIPLVGELLEEIMKCIDVRAFDFNRQNAHTQAEQMIADGSYWVFVAEELGANKLVGFVSLYESFALYAQGAYGTIPELYVRPDWRSKQVGRQLLEAAADFGKQKGWHRIEVTTPPLPEFERTLNFYQANGFEISGGRKLKKDIDC